MGERALKRLQVTQSGRLLKEPIVRKQLVWSLVGAPIAVLSIIAWEVLRFKVLGDPTSILVVFLLLACYTFIVAGFGHSFGSLGAWVIALVILIVSTTADAYLWIAGEDYPAHCVWTAGEHFWRHVLASLYLFGTLQFITAAPMFVAFRWPWLLRMVVGLVGAALASLVMPLLGFYAVCAALHDCL